MIKGRRVYDPLTNTYSTGWWIVDDKGNYYPVWQKGAVMNIDEFIKHTKEKAEEYKYRASFFESDNPMNKACIKVAKDHEQLAEWFEKSKEYQQLEEQGRLVKLPAKDDTTGYRECVHIKSTCYHENYKCSECPLTELFCDEFYLAIDRCYEDAYANGCLAGMELAQSAAEKKLKELR